MQVVWLGRDAREQEREDLEEQNRRRRETQSTRVIELTWAREAHTEQSSSEACVECTSEMPS